MVLWLSQLSLLPRLSADVQDFKSSFKEVFSQGLRSFTQTLGCVGSLFFISPQMTAVVGVSLPLMIAVGSLLGHVLRKWSRDAQEQVGVVLRGRGHRQNTCVRVVLVFV